MQSLSGRERIARIVRREPVDRIGLFEHFWPDTLQKWHQEGSLAPGQSIFDVFPFDLGQSWPFNLVADLTEPEVVEETEETILTRDGNGALLRRHKLHSSTPEHVDFRVQTRQDWYEWILPFLSPDPQRINFSAYAAAKKKAEEQQRFFTWSGLNVFEAIRSVCGHQYMLMGMALDPDWFKEMATTYTDLTLTMMDMLFDQEGPPDGIWFFEDFGFKGKPFISPTMYRELVQPFHQRSFAYAKRRRLPVFLHSCGYIAPLVPLFIEAGVDCLQAIEVKAGMDLVQLYRDYGDVLSFMGGIDVRTLASNDPETLRRELVSKIPIVRENYGYVLHSDHSIPTNVEFQSFKTFVDIGLQLGTY